MDALRHTCLTRGPFKSIRWRFPSSAPAVDIIAGVNVVGVIGAVVVTCSLRSFFLKRRRDVSSCSVAISFVIGASLLFAVFVAADSTCLVGDFDDSLTSVAFLMAALFGDNEEVRLVAMIDGFSRILGTICGELPNFELFSANGLLNELNVRNSVLSVLSFVVEDQLVTNRRHVDNELPKRLFNPPDFGDNGSTVFVSGLI